MKKLYSCLFILTFFASCTNEEPSKPEEGAALTYRGTADVLPSYSLNPYDNTGRVYDAIFDSYYNGSTLPTSTTDIIARVQQIANANESFDTLNTSGYVPLNTVHVNYLAGLGKADIATVIGSSNLSTAAKSSFSEFVTTIVSLYDTETDPALIYNAFVKYEAAVIGSTTFTANDKRIILTTTSITRYTAYRAKKKPKKNTDPDWIIFVAHIFGSEDGSDENAAKGIVQGLACGIVSNK